MKYKSALAFTLVLVLMVTLAGCGDRNRLEWPNTTLGERLPNPPVKSGEITLETSDSLMADAFDASEKDYKNFVENCKERGFTVDSKEEDYTFSAYDGDGYFIDIQYWESDEKISIIVRDSIEVKFAEFSWPKSDIASSVPVPKSNIGTISWDGEKSFLIYVGNTSKDDYAEYVNQCYGAGFTVDCSRRDEQFNGVNEDGYHLSVDYERNQTMSIRLYTADMLGEEPPTSVSTAPPQTAPNASPSSSFEGQTDNPGNTGDLPSESSENSPPKKDNSEQVQPSLDYKDGYLVADYDYLRNPLPGTAPKDVYLTGEITQVNDWLIAVTDATNHTWTVDLGTDRDFSDYAGTDCEVYGGCVGGISSQYHTPLIFMDGNSDYHCVFSDGKEFFPSSYDSVQQFSRRDFGNANDGEGRVVWIPTDGGTKYHSTSTCSGMLNPEQVSERDAINRGFSPCGRCW